MAAHDGEETGNRRQGKYMLEIVIPGKPIAKKRPRFARRGRFTTTYSAQETEESKIMAQIISLLGEKWEPIKGPLSMSFIFEFERPKTHYGTGKNAGILKGSAPVFHIQKPDLDNLKKFYLDAMNELVFKDDSQVVDITAKKMWGSEGKTSVKIEKRG